MKYLHYSIFLGGCFFLCSCSLGPDYVRPEIELPSTYREASYSRTNARIPKWREFFHDENLLSIIEHALEENKELAIAAARIVEASAQLGVVRGEQFPELDITGQAARNQISEEVISFPIRLMNSFALGVGASYELDLWGKYSQATKAQQAVLLSTAYAAESLRISLISTVAQSYYELLDLDARLQIAQRTVENRLGATKLIRQRFEGGVVSELDLNQAQIEEGEARASVAELERLRAKTENALNILLGRTPVYLQRGSSLALTEVTLIFPMQVPAALLQNRPDILSAEEELRATVEEIGVAEADRLPGISLFGVIGLGSRESDTLFQSSAKTWGFGGDLVGPILDFGRRKSAVQAAEARSVQALKAYEQTVLGAVGEVEDALIEIKTFHDELKARDAQRRAASHAAKLSRARYNDGVTNYLEVLDIERSLFRAELNTSSTRGRLMKSYISLFRALGGGWDRGTS